MSRRVRHVHARPGEHIYVHRHDHPRHRPTPVYTPASPTFGDMVRAFFRFLKKLFYWVLVLFLVLFILFIIIIIIIGILSSK